MSNKPNYDYLLKLERWSKKDAALIVCGFDPDDYRAISFSQKAIPDELQEAYNVYRLFRSVDFIGKYSVQGLHPLNYISECHEKEIALSDELQAAVKRRIEYVRNHKAQEETPLSQESAHMRERQYLLKIIGALTMVYFVEKDKTTHRENTRYVISDVVEAILQLIANQDLQSPGLGRSNLFKKISEAMALFRGEKL